MRKHNILGGSTSRLRDGQNGNSAGQNHQADNGQEKLCELHLEMD
jgi:hypothetical protein